MTNPTAPAEHLLMLAADFTRHNDALAAIHLGASSPATALTHQADLTQHLAESALHIVNVLNAQPMYRSRVIRAVYARVQQLAQLATSGSPWTSSTTTAPESPARRKPAPGRSRQPRDPRTNQTALGAPDALTTAELYVTERRHQGDHPVRQPPALTHAQHVALRAVAQGEVTITADGKAYVRRGDLRVSISTIRSLEARGLVAREPCHLGLGLGLGDERVHLTPDGSRHLAAAFGRPRLPAPPAPVRPRPRHTRQPAEPHLPRTDHPELHGRYRPPRHLHRLDRRRLDLRRRQPADPQRRPHPDRCGVHRPDD
jgi:hypothetical protein